LKALGKHVRVPDERVPEPLASRIEGDAPQLPDLALELRKAAISAGKAGEEIEAYAVARAKQTLGLTIKFVNRVSGKSDYADALRVGRKETFVYKDKKWVTVKKDELDQFLAQFLDGKQLSTWRYAYDLRLSFLSLYYYLSSILQRLDMIELGGA